MVLGTIVGAAFLFYVFVAACLYLTPEKPDLSGCDEESFKSTEM